MCVCVCAVLPYKTPQSPYVRAWPLIGCLDLELFLCDGLKGENLSKKAKEKKEAFIKRIKEVKLGYACGFWTCHLQLTLIHKVKVVNICLLSAQ